MQNLPGRRWALRILWELRSEAKSFRALREACDDVSPTVLNTRLAELRDARLLAVGDAGYGVTDLGRSLCEAIAPLQRWAERWARAQAGGRA
jgi:DNA-binding HxlR family transcriptional regulator